MTQDQLADASGLKQPDISKLEVGGMLKTTGIARVSEALRVSARWLELGDGPEPDWEGLHTTRERSPRFGGVAQKLSLLSAEDAFPMLKWEAILRDEVPELFRTLLPDDAVAPDFPSGTEVLWTTNRRAGPGRLLLVKDRHGQPHARMCRQGSAPGSWVAAALNSAFLSFAQDEIELIAVYKGRLEPDDK